MEQDVTIRPYELRDRPAVRQIAFDTADNGEPASFFSDREVFADILTRYYTDFEPQSLWVVDHAGQAVGYLSGCLDDRRYQRVMAWRVVPAALVRAIARGALARRETWRLLGALVRTWRSGEFHQPAALAHYPAHLHINIRQGFRGQQIGPRLVERFVEQARAAGVGGIHAGVHEDNQPARRFFERLGFVPLGHYAMVLPDGETYRIGGTIVYGKQV
jgi:GNAT superfamily N-acetyltransferase